jgi:amino acid transporter
MVIGACLKAVGVLNTYLCTCSQMLAAWGDKNLLGMKFLSAQSRFGTPWVALVINSFLVAAGTVFSFQFLIQLDQLFYSIGLLLEYLSLLVLRYKVLVTFILLVLHKTNVTSNRIYCGRIEFQ